MLLRNNKKLFYEKYIPTGGGGGVQMTSKIPFHSAIGSEKNSFPSKLKTKISFV